MGGGALFLSSSSWCVLINSETSRMEHNVGDHSKRTLRSRVPTRASNSSDCRMFFSTWSALDCMREISKARSLAWVLSGNTSHSQHKSNCKERTCSVSFPCTILLNTGAVGTVKVIVAALLWHSCHEELQINERERLCAMFVSVCCFWMGTKEAIWK